MAQVTKSTPLYYKLDENGVMTDEVDYGAMAEHAKLSLESMKESNNESGGGFLLGLLLGSVL